jgi:anti-anti-sigma factor
VPYSARIACHSSTLRPFACSSSGGGLDAAWVHVAGALDIATSPQLERTLREARARVVVLDLREVAFMDSAGAHTILAASLDARDAGRRLIVLRGAPAVDRVFSLTGSSEVLDIGDVELPDPAVQPLRLFALDALVP